MLATIINFSSNEARFLRHCLEEARLFSDQILIPVCDHFFDGKPENSSLLQGIYQAHPDITFLQYAWSKDNFYGRHSTHFWHNLSRLIGTYYVKSEITHILFLDVDEIVEGKRFARWLRTFPLSEYSALHLACYWYFREASYRAKKIEDTPLLTCKSALHYDALMNSEERGGTYQILEGKKLRYACKEDPLIHHYSWVRSKEECLRKVRSWGHSCERDWERHVEEEFSKPFSGRDFVHGYTFTKVEPYLKTGSYQPSNQKPDNVHYLTTRDIHKIDLELKFGA
ncbi:MAG: hypothetical protein K1000chlam2_00199 [Chlamydiae bacterium]|nr:hypothetical protein [Chlamydiota bacterium]